MSASDAIKRARMLLSVREQLLAEIEDAVAQRDALAFLKLRAELERLDGQPPGAYKYGIPERAAAQSAPQRKGGQKKGNGGAPRLEERADWPEKQKKAREWLDLVASGKTQEVAAGMIGYHVDTLRKWAKRSGLL